MSDPPPFEPHDVLRSNAPQQGPRALPGPNQLALRDVLVLIMGIAAGCGVAAMARQDEPSLWLALVLVLLWLGVGVWFLVNGVRRKSCLLELLGEFFLLSFAVVAILPAKSRARTTACRMQCGNNMKQIALALLNYNDSYGTLPPAYVTDKNGQPVHS